MESKGYNGWENHETWSVWLWIDNSEASQHYWRDAACDAILNASNSKYLPRRDRAIRDLEAQLREEFFDANPLRDRCDVFADLLYTALNDVYWYQIARTLVEDYWKEVMSEEEEEEETADA